MTKNTELSQLSSFLFPINKISQSAPAPEEVFIILGNLNTFHDISVSYREKQHAQSMISEIAKLRFLAGRRLLRGILSRWLDIDPAMIPLEITSRGKPFLKKARNCHFSIAHSGELVIIAFACFCIGIDLEKERSVNTLALSRRFFSEEEVGILENDRSLKKFFSLWTCREAAIKGDGRGMASLLALTRVRLLSENKMSVFIEKEEWLTYVWNLENDYHVAVALSEEPSLIYWCDLR